MSVRNSVFAAFVLASASAIGVQYSNAATIFDLSPSNNTTFRSPDDGPGQGVSVSQNTTITSFSFFADMPNGGDLKFMIWDSTNSNMLLSQVVSVGASNSLGWISSGALSFNLLAGDTYYFGIIGDNNLDVGFIFPTVAYSSNGLTALSNGNSNYDNFSNPVVQSQLASAEIALRIDGVTSAVPEPSTWAMMLLGFAGVGYVSFRQARRRAFAA
jgi:hypothetical protein